MSTINEHNLDELLFDYLEGNLNQDQAAELSDFLVQNPQYAVELEAWKGTIVEAPAKAPAYAGASALMRPVGGAASLPGKSGWAGSGIGIVGTVIAVTSMVLFWQLWTPAEKTQAPVQEEVIVQQEEVTEPIAPESEASVPPFSEEIPEPVTYEKPIAARKTVQPTKLKEKSSPKVSTVATKADPVESVVIEEVPELIPEPIVEQSVAPEKEIVTEILPEPKVPPLPTPVEVTPPPADSSPPVVIQQQDYPEVQGQTKRGRKKRLRNKKPVRVVPLKSDAF